MIKGKKLPVDRGFLPLIFCSGYVYILHFYGKIKLIDIDTKLYRMRCKKAYGIENFY